MLFYKCLKPVYCSVKKHVTLHILKPKILQFQNKVGVDRNTLIFLT